MTAPPGGARCAAAARGAARTQRAHVGSDGSGREHDEDGQGGRCADRRKRAAPRPPVHGADAEHEQRHRPREERGREQAEQGAAAAGVLAAATEEVVTQSASLIGQRRSDSASGTAANASTCRERQLMP